jgi:hypothetical protein
MILEIAVVDDNTNTNFFFGYLGIACALVFASKQLRWTKSVGRPRLGLRIGEKRRRHYEHGRVET